MPLESPARPRSLQAAPLGRADRRSPTCCRCSRTWASRSPTSGRTRSRRPTARRSGSTTSGCVTTRAPSSQADDVREALPGRLRARSGAARSRTTASTGSSLGAGLTAREITVLRAYREVPAPGGTHVQPGVHGGDARRASATSRARWSSCSRRASTRRARRRRREARAARRARSRTRSTRSRASTRTASCAASSRVIRATLRTNYFQTDARRRAEAVPLVQARPARDPGPARSRGRCSRSSSTRRASRACTCAAARSRAAASAGPTGARTSAPRSSA